jgi:alpha-glucosidase
MSVSAAPFVALADRLDELVLYQAYPQSFADGNGDGIGDLIGLRERLDYLSWLGVDVVWLNPCFVSPFRDAGYDVADYLSVAPRYGSNDDLAELCRAAAERGIGVVLDLVAGHTSDEHPWFLAASAPGAEPAVRDRYLWSPRPQPGWVPCGEGAYLPNFLDFQPALNYGYARPDPDQPWCQPVDAPGPQANREALKQIMAHWFDLGVSGFRVDMAASLVKDDPELVETRRLWTELRGWLDANYPGRMLIAEWGDPALSVPAGFHADMFVHFGGSDNGLPLRSLWQNGGGTVSDYWPAHSCWAASVGEGSLATFAAAWRQASAAIAQAHPETGYGRGGVIGLPTANHDFSRLVAGDRDVRQAAAALALVFTWPTMPCLYYGDELGMRYLPGLEPFEGSRLEPRFERAGSRTPMAWGDLARTPFPATTNESRYLPSDPAPDAPTVAGQLDDSDSLLHLTRTLIGLRHRDPRLSAGAPLALLADGYPSAYLRGADESLLVVLNPSGRPATWPWPLGERARILVSQGAQLEADRIELKPHGFAVIDLRGESNE